MKLQKITALACLILLSTTGLAQTAAEGTTEPSAAMKKAMDPAVWQTLMNSIMSGQMQTQNMSSGCLVCHSQDELNQFSANQDPAMQGIMNHMSPNTMMGMNPMMMQGMNPMMMQGMNPMMGMNPMQGMNPMMMQGMNPMMQGMNPMMMQGMNPMMMQGMNPMMMQGMNPMMQGMNPNASGGNQLPSIQQGGQQSLMNPEQYRQYYQKFQDMMSKMNQSNQTSESAPSNQ